MTVIVADRLLMMMASDSIWNSHEGQIETGPKKLKRYKQFIAGFCGSMTDIASVSMWLKHMDMDNRPKVKEFGCLLLYRDGRLFEMDEALLPMQIDMQYAAIGEGSISALSAMDTMKFLGVPTDPRTAVRVASQRNAFTGGKVRYMRWGSR